jgi:GMP synthase-like glutamine amidotransferase
VSGPGPGGDRPWTVLQHVDLGVPEPLADALNGAGVRHTVVPAHREPLPSVGEVGGLVVLGGPMGVHEDDAHPWLAPERSLLASAVSAGVPVLAVCLGAQQLAAALGAEVTAGPRPEIGPGSVTLTADGRRDPVLGPEYRGLGDPTLTCFHWHGDTFALPEGAVHLAGTRACPHQAFRLGRRIYALQFHVELDAEVAARWGPVLPDGVVLSPSLVERVASVGRRLFTRFLAVAMSPPAPRL